MNISTDQLNNLKSLKNIFFQNSQLNNVKPAEFSNEYSLVFISNPESLKVALSKNVKSFVVLEKIMPDIQNLISDRYCVWTTPQINYAMSEVLPFFNPKEKKSNQIHPMTSIDPTAQIGKNVTVDPFAVIKKNAVIGDNCWIKSNALIEEGAQIGSDTEIGSQSVIGSYCQIGKNCLISGHVQIGSDGFGFYSDKTYTHHKVAQIGIVVIEDNCEVGSHCAIDRATLTQTLIKKGTKFDNFFHVAHNCEIGENSLLAGGFMVAGSTKTGRNLTTAGGVHLNGHITVTDNVVFAGNAGVISNVTEPGVYGGYPQVPHKENLRVMAALPYLPQMKKQVLQIMKHLGMDTGKI